VAAGDIPTSHITSFDRSQYDRLIRTIDGIDNSLSEQFLKPGVDIHLDETLGSRIKIGNSAWTVVSDFTAAAGKFGTSIDQQNEGFSDDWRDFIAALNEAKDVFEDTNNLANYSAKDFLEDYPDLGPDTGSTSP